MAQMELAAVTTVLTARRDRVISHLSAGFSHDALDTEEFDRRIGLAYNATTRRLAPGAAAALPAGDSRTKPDR